MSVSRTGSLLVVTVIAASIGAIAASLLTTNTLLLDSPWRVAAGASLVTVVGTLCLFAGVGRVWQRRLSTQYW